MSIDKSISTVLKLNSKPNLFTWVFWSIAYFFRPLPTSLVDYLIKTKRTTNLYRKFKPAVIYNEIGKKWQIYLSDELFYVRPHQTIQVDVYISDKTGKCIGFNVNEESLENISRNHVSPSHN